MDTGNDSVSSLTFLKRSLCHVGRTNKKYQTPKRMSFFLYKIWCFFFNFVGFIWVQGFPLRKLKRYIFRVTSWKTTCLAWRYAFSPWIQLHFLKWWLCIDKKVWKERNCRRNLLQILGLSPSRSALQNRRILQYTLADIYEIVGVCKNQKSLQR